MKIYNVDIRKVKEEIFTIHMISPDIQDLQDRVNSFIKELNEIPGGATYSVMSYTEDDTFNKV